LARIGIAAGADGMIVEVHPNPDKALSDGDQSLDFAEFDAMMAALEPWIVLRAVSAQEEAFAHHGIAGSCPLEAAG
jgi:3-deoxy-D-arabino-heptulosonate 7-phosphate (DAHP) synthase